MKWKCLVVDDEPPALNILEKYIGMVEHLELAATCSNAFHAIEFMQTNKIDLIFLDIQLPRLTGTSFLKTLMHPPKVIFTTAYKEFASEAFDLDAVDYLVKPVSLERFLKAVNKLAPAAIAKTNKQVAAVDDGFVYFRSDRKMVKVFLEEITHIESLRDYIKVYRLGGKPLLVKQSMGTLEAMLPADLFIRIHRSFVVSVNKITAFTSREVELGAIEIPVGRLYAERLKDVCNQKK
ncbi:MAG: LytTR family DNA-binding domain-containing protein [Chitinophagaceae bacterium]